MLTVTDDGVESVAVACFLTPREMKILCVDDDPDDFGLFREAVQFTQSNCTCFHAADGHQAISWLQLQTPDIIFLDNNMPMMNGYETLQQIHQDNLLHSTPVYLLSTSITRADREQFARLKVVDCLVKPDSFASLCALVKIVLQRHLAEL